MSKAITGHEAVGMPIEYGDIKGKIVAVKFGSQLWKVDTPDGFQIEPKKTITYKIQPDNGGKCFWSPQCIIKSEAK